MHSTNIRGRISVLFWVVIYHFFCSSWDKASRMKYLDKLYNEESLIDDLSFIKEQSAARLAQQFAESRGENIKIVLQVKHEIWDEENIISYNFKKLNKT